MGARRVAAHAAAAQLMLFAFSGNAAAAGCPAASVQPGAAPGGAAVAVVCELNVIRGNGTLRPLQADTRLAAAAQHLADDMAARHYFSHVTPEGVGLAQRIRVTG